MDEEKEKMDTVEFLLSKPKKAIMLVDKTMKGWNREKTTLPEDLHYSGHELVRLKVLNFKTSWFLFFKTAYSYTLGNFPENGFWTPPIN